MRKLFSLILALCLLLSVVPVSLATEDGLTEGEPVSLEEEVISGENGITEEPAAELTEEPLDAGEEPEGEDLPGSAAASDPEEDAGPQKDTDEEEKGDSSLIPTAGQLEQNEPQGNTQLENVADENVEKPSAVLPAAEEKVEEAEQSTGEEKDGQIEQYATEENLSDEEGKEPEAEESAPGFTVDDSEIDVNAIAPDRLRRITFTDMQATEVTLEWDEVDKPNGAADGYEISWATTDSFDDAKKNAVTTENTSWTIEGLTCGVTYYIFVRAYYIIEGSAGVVSAWAKPLMKAYTPAPAAPTGFQAEQLDDSATKMVFTWNRVPEASGYNIYDVTNGTKKKIATLNQNPADKATLTMTVGNIVPADKLVYWIYSYKTVNKKQVESTEHSDPCEVEYYVPAPLNLTAESKGKDSVRLTWKAVEGVTKYVVERNDGSDEYLVLSEQTATTYTDTKLTFGKVYTYYVTAWVGDREGITTSGVDGQATGVAPGNVKVENLADENSNKVSWSKVDDADGYIVEIRGGIDEGTGEYEWISMPAGINTYYIDPNLTYGQEYLYRVKAYQCPFTYDPNVKVYTPVSSAVSTVARPPKPQGLVLTNLDYDSQELVWNSIEDVDGYALEISTSSTFATVTKEDIPFSAEETVSYINDGCKNATKYYYRIRAYVKDQANQMVYGPYSATKSLKCAPAKPEEVHADYTPGVNQAKVTWTIADGATDYVVYYKENDSSAWTTAETVKATTADPQSYTMKNLHIGSTYSFAVSSVRTTSDGKSATGQKTEAEENPVSIEITDFQPAGLTYTVVNRKKVTLSWKSIKGISLYAVTGVCLEGDDAFENTFGEKEVSGTSLTVSGLKPGHRYIFTVRAKVMVNGVAKYGDPGTAIEVVPTSLAPASLKVSANTKNYGASLSWEKSTGATGYKIEYASSQYAADDEWNELIIITDANELSYQDKNRFTADDAGDVVYYRVRSYIEYDGKQWSTPSAAVKLQIKVPTPAVKTVAEDKSVVRIQVTNTGDIENGTNESVISYELSRSTSATSGFEVLSIVPEVDEEGILTFRDTTAKFGTVYYYKVMAVVTNTHGISKSAKSSAVSGQGKLKPVEGLDVSDEHGGSVDLVWDALYGATGYDVFYKSEGGKWTFFQNVSDTSVRVTGLNPKSQYLFRVAGTAKASGKTIRGNYSESVSGRTAIDVPVIKSVNPASCTSITVKWKKTVDATSYQVVAEDDAGNVVKKTVSGTSVTITDLGKNRTYSIRIRAIIKQNSITDTSEYCVDWEGYTAPAKVTNLTASSIGKNQLILSWNKSAGADGYIVEWTDPETGEYHSMDLAGYKNTSQTITGLTKNTSYTFYVTPYGKEGAEVHLGAEATYTVKTAKK